MLRPERHNAAFVSAFFWAALLLTACDNKTDPYTNIPTVTYMQSSPKSVTLTTELPGRTSAFMISEVRPQVSGIILERLFVEGSDVKQGDVLYQIDPALYQAAYDNAKATLMKVEANAVAAGLLAERYRQVVKVNAVSKQEYDNAEAAYGQAQAEVAAAKAALDTAAINLAYTRVKAPVSGRIGRSSVTSGALVTQNQPNALAIIQQIDTVYVDVTQSSTEMLRLKKAFSSGALKSSGETALKASLILEDGAPYQQRIIQKDPVSGKGMTDETGNPVYTLEPVTGSLKFSEATVEQSTGAVAIRAVFPNPEGLLLPGMYVRTLLEEGVNDKAFLLPQKTVVRNSRGLPVVQVLTKNATLTDQEEVYNVTPRILELDRVIDNEWLVTGGIREGDKVVLEGLQKIRPGMPVRGVQARIPAGGSPDRGAAANATRAGDSASGK
ncbi:MAG: efflux RND transporter periplasmic adaptor subunit [Desulfovibrio sp.]|nr:efflux RND transporter periplasmic adaptor subunit [Desulfovibrio sp.]